MKAGAKLFLIIFSLAFFGALADRTLYAREIADKKVILHFFWGNGCPHCEEEKKFLIKLNKQYPDLEIKTYEVWENAKNRDLFKQVGELLKTDVAGVPFTVVGTSYTVGFFTDDTTGEQIRRHVDYCLKNSCSDVMDLLSLVSSSTSKDEKPPVTSLPATSQIPDQKSTGQPASPNTEVNLPVIGRINLTTLSLPLIAVILGALDGFNPCAMWVLLFLISLLINLPDRGRRWVLGFSFLLASGLVYFFFMAAWLNVLLFVGFISWVRAAIGLFAIVAGALSLNKFLKNKTGCEVSNTESRKKTFENLRKYAYDKRLLTALLGIVGLAFAVNLVELLCSAGFPAVFTQILALNRLSGLQYYLYIGIYILFFMLDDMIVFFLAMRTLELTGLSTKYSKISNLVGGLLMLAIGLLLIFKPNILMFSF